MRASLLTFADVLSEAAASLVIGEESKTIMYQSPPVHETQSDSKVASDAAYRDF